MKSLLKITLSLLLIITSSVVFADEIKIGSNSKTAALEVRFKITGKSTKKATFNIVNEAGVIVNTFKADVVKGDNIVTLAKALNLKEGSYTVNILLKNKTLSTRFMIFE